MEHTFDIAELVLGQGEASRRFKPRDVRLHVEQAERGYKPPPNIKCPFLNGKIKAEGTMVEECAPGKSLLSKGKEAVLKLTTHGQWTLVKILILDRLDIRSPERGVRHYHWSFLVVGRASDSLNLFVNSDVDPNMLEIEDLLDLLGATPDEIGKTKDGQAVHYNTEGGFRIAEGGEEN